MEHKDEFAQIQLIFKNNLTTIDLSDTFYKLSEGEIGITQKKYRNLYSEKLDINEFNQLMTSIKSATIKSEQLVIEFFERNREEVEPLYSNELDHYDIQVDLISSGLNKKDDELPAFEFDILIDCMDKDDQPIFMYDSRGCCTISFQVSRLNELVVKEIS